MNNIELKLNLENSVFGKLHEEDAQVIVRALAAQDILSEKLETVDLIQNNNRVTIIANGYLELDIALPNAPRSVKKECNWYLTSFINNPVIANYSVEHNK